MAVEDDKIVQHEIDRIKKQLSIAHDNGDVYQYIQLNYRQFRLNWQEGPINEVLRGLSDINARIISFSTDEDKTTFLFKLIYN